MECQSDGIPVGRRATAGAERARGQGVRDLFGVRDRSLRHGCGAAAASGDGPECEEHAGTTLTARRVRKAPRIRMSVPASAPASASMSDPLGFLLLQAVRDSCETPLGVAPD